MINSQSLLTGLGLSLSTLGLFYYGWAFQLHRRHRHRAIYRPRLKWDWSRELDHQGEWDKPLDEIRTKGKVLGHENLGGDLK